MSEGLRLLLVAPNAANNSLGRAHCLWLLARRLGWQVTVVTVRGEQLWQPLRDDPFAADCVLLAAATEPERQAALTGLAVRADVVIAVKPLPSSFGLALPLGRATGRPVTLDVDDPDIEVRTTHQSLRRVVKDRLLTGRHRELLRLRELARTVPVTVSNPVLQGWYGGLLVPHVRPAAEAGPQSSGRDIVVRFIGSPRGHKGLDVLRESVASFSGEGVRLEVTADAPQDARPWEVWLGQTSLAAGRALVANADVVAVPSVLDGWSRAQLPAKLVDAMILGRAVVASDLPPLRWAVGDTALLVAPGDVAALTGALARLRDPGLRGSLGAAAHARAKEMFSVEAVAPRFGDFVRTVASSGHARPARHVEGTSEGTSVSRPPTVVVAVLTYRRQRQLTALLPELVRQAAHCGRPAGVLVVDNDPDGGAAAVVGELAEPAVTYVHEPVPGIAAARNRALLAAGGADVLVFIDDDEWPCERWLRLLLAGYDQDRPTGVCGPVVTTYENPPSRWLQAGRFFDRPRPPTGTPLPAAATNNLLLDLAQVRALGVEFDEAYSLSGGSDTLFTRQLVARGGRLVWCDEAEVVDTLPASRSSLGWVLRRGMRIGITWSRTSLDLAGSAPARARERAGATVGGLGRMVAGVGQLAAGLATRSPYRQARGLKAAARGLGLLLGAYGVRYPEYRRLPSRADAT